MAGYWEANFLVPWTYITKLKGKNLRELLIDGLNVWIGADAETKTRTQKIIDDLHNASLLIDDIEDKSALRRGLPTAHTVFGIALTINAANYVYFDVLKRLQDARVDAASQQLFTTEMLRLHWGQGKELYWRDILAADAVIPSQDDYIAMVRDKTGGLFRMAAGLLAASKQADASLYTTFLDRLAEYYQIRDDLINLTSDSYQQTKGFCEDLTEGKLSFPIICGCSRDHAVFDMLRTRPTDDASKSKIVEHLRSLGAFEETQRHLDRIKRELEAEVTRLGENALISKLLSLLFAS